MVASLCRQVLVWMNRSTASRYISQIRRHIVRYMCKFAEKDLRQAATRTMTDIVWQALREPRGTIAVGTGGTINEVFTLDSDGLELAFKYFTCSMLTLRLAGIAQINVCYYIYCCVLKCVYLTQSH